MSLPTLILLPGLLCDATAWQHQIDHLQDQVRIIVPDLSQATCAKEMVAAVLQSAPPTFMLAGHSMGGWVALEIMKHDPKRVLKLCLANTTAQLDSPEKKQARLEMIALAKEGKFEAIVERLSTAFVYQQQYLPTVKAMLRRNQHAFINQQTAMLNRESCCRTLITITCPTVIIHASHDRVFNDNDCMALVNCIPKASLEIIEDAGHMSLIEQSAQFTAIMHKWLQQ